jgi:hypothetical protein
MTTVGRTRKWTTSMTIRPRNILYDCEKDLFISASRKTKQRRAHDPSWVLTY